MIAAPPAWVRGYIGLPYLKGGRSRAGVDCWGLVCLVFAERLRTDLDLCVAVSVDAPLLAEREIAVAKVSGAWERIGIAEAAAYDIALLAAAVGGPGSRCVADIHCGVVVAPGWLLHTEGPAGAVCQRFDALGRRLREVWRLKGVDHAA